MQKMTKLILLTICMLLKNTASAVYFSSYIYEMMADEEFISKVVNNDTKNLNLYQISSFQIDKPGKGGENLIHPKKRELIYSPLSMQIEPSAQNFFKILYIGPKDDQERYYRVVFNETALAAIKKHDQSIETTFFPSVALSTILIVRPRLLKFSYEIDEEKGVIKNTGNTFFRVIIQQGCNGHDEDAHQFYILPGETYMDQTVALNNKKFIILNKKYLQLGRGCFI